MPPEESTTSLEEDMKLLREEGEPESEGKIKVESPERKVRESKESKESEDDEEIEDDDSEEEDSEEEDTESEDEEEDDLDSDKLPIRHSYSEIKAKHPKIFQEFPDLKHMFMREQAYSELFPTVESAREAQSSIEAFNTLQADIFSGSSERFLTAIKTSDESGLKKFASNFLPTLMKLDSDAHWQATTPLLQGMVRKMYSDGARKGDENTKNAALIISDYLFQDFDVAKGTKSAIVEQENKVDPREADLQKREQAYQSQRQNDFQRDLISTGDRKLNSIILSKDENGNFNMDKDSELSDFVRNAIVVKVKDEVNEKLKSDKAHMTYMTSLWNQAVKAGLTSDWKDKINSAYLARAKSLVPEIRKRLVAEALGKSPKRLEKQANNHQKVISRREPGSSGRSSKGSDRVDFSLPKGKDFYDKNSDLAILNMD